MNLLPEFFDFEVDSLVETDLCLVLTLRSGAKTAECPVCSNQASRVQSRYVRSLSDLPVFGQPVRLLLSVRRFY